MRRQQGYLEHVDWSVLASFAKDLTAVQRIVPGHVPEMEMRVEHLRQQPRWLRLCIPGLASAIQSPSLGNRFQDVQ